MKDLLILTDARMCAHDMGDGHPESPERLRALLDLLDARFADLPRRAPTPVSREAIARVHAARHIDAVDAARDRAIVFDADTRTSPASVEAAYLAAGAAVDGVDAVLDGDARRVFALVRPPGHHAEADEVMGFCFFNNIAVAAEHALSRGCERVLVVDWDVHHGNGTQHSFEARADLLFFDVHEWPLFPGTGAADERGTGEGEGFTVNVPLPAGSGDEDYLEVFDRVLLPKARAYRPDIVLVSAGFDAHEYDPLAGMRVTDRGFAEMCRRVVGLADELCEGRLFLTLEGGYDLDGLTGGVAACLEVLAR